MTVARLRYCQHCCSIWQTVAVMKGVCAHGSTAAGGDADARNVAEARLREDHGRRTQIVVLGDGDRERCAGTGEVRGQQATQQTVDEVECATCDTCTLHQRAACSSVAAEDEV